MPRHDMTFPAITRITKTMNLFAAVPFVLRAFPAAFRNLFGAFGAFGSVLGAVFRMVINPLSFKLLGFILCAAGIYLIACLPLFEGYVSLIEKHILDLVEKCRPLIHKYLPPIAKHVALIAEYLGLVGQTLASIAHYLVGAIKAIAELAVLLFESIVISTTLALRGSYTLFYIQTAPVYGDARRRGAAVADAIGKKGAWASHQIQ